MTRIMPLGLGGVLEITPDRKADDRGFFSETWNREVFAATGIDAAFVQDNHVHSRSRGVLRGLHYQLPPNAQDKLVRVVAGAIYCVAVDVCSGSPTFGEWVPLEVSAERWNQIFVPRGFAFGYVTLVDNVEVAYKVTDVYAPAQERAVRFDDPDIGIAWPFAPADIIISDRDLKAPRLGAAEVFA
jgi:dTDP-4-dehydrorhamnose 3,5-epimerase